MTLLRHQKVWIFGVAASVLFFAFYALVTRDLIPQRSWTIAIPLQSAAWHALFPGFAVALLGVLLVERLRSPYRLIIFSLGRCLGALTLFLLLSYPLGYLPVSNGFLLFGYVSGGPTANFGNELIVLISCFLVAAILAHGIKDRLGRVAAYVLVWNGVFFGVPLLYGLPVINI